LLYNPILKKKKKKKKKKPQKKKLQKKKQKKKIEKTRILNTVKMLTNIGRHLEASNLFDKHFPNFLIK